MKSSACRVYITSLICLLSFAHLSFTDEKQPVKTPATNVEKVSTADAARRIEGYLKDTSGTTPNLVTFGPVFAQCLRDWQKQNRAEIEGYRQKCAALLPGSTPTSSLGSAGSGFYAFHHAALSESLQKINTRGYATRTELAQLEKGMKAWEEQERKLQQLFNEARELAKAQDRVFEIEDEDEANKVADEIRASTQELIVRYFTLQHTTLFGPVGSDETTGATSNARAFVVDDQIRRAAALRPDLVSPSLSSLVVANKRLLFVCGLDLDLPKHTVVTREVSLQSGDPKISYQLVSVYGTPEALTSKEVMEANKAAWDRGWKQALQGLSLEEQETLKKADALLVRAELRSGLFPGMKRFDVQRVLESNSRPQPVLWLLTEGTAAAELRFVRSISETEFEAARDLYLPETVRIEVVTDNEYDLPDFPIALGLNGERIQFGEEETISAARVGPKVFRTRSIELWESRNVNPARYAEVYRIPAKPGDTLEAMGWTSGLLKFHNPVVTARILRTPGDSVWFQAMDRAIKLHLNLKTQDGKPLATQPIHQISKIIITEGLYEVMAPARPKDAALAAAGVVFPIGTWVVGQTTESKTPTRGQGIRRIPVSLGDHAAMLLLRDTFVEMMKPCIEEFDKDFPPGRPVSATMQRAIRSRLIDDGFYLAKVPLLINNPGTTREQILKDLADLGTSKSVIEFVSGHFTPIIGVTLREALSDEFADRHFGGVHDSAWESAMIDLAVQVYRESMKYALKRAEAVSDGDIEALMNLTGNNFGTVADRVVSRLMKLEETGTPKRLIWIPDQEGKRYVKGLDDTFEAVRAQKEYADCDKQVVLAAASLLAPLVGAPSILGQALNVVSNVATFADSVARALPDYIRQTQEFNFSVGAMAALGKGRLDVAALSETPLWGMMLDIFGNAPGLGDAWITLAKAGSPAALARGAALFAKLEPKTGLKALWSLSKEEAASVLVYVGDVAVKSGQKAESVLTAAEKRPQQLLAQWSQEAKSGEKVGVPSHFDPNEKTWVMGKDSGHEPGPGQHEIIPEPVPKPTPVPEPSRPLPTLVEVKTPAANSVWRAPDGKEFRLGKQLGQGEYATVYSLLDGQGNATGEVFKTIRSPEFDGSTPKEIVERMARGQVVLQEGGIRYLEVTRFQPDGEFPYIVQRVLEKPRMMQFKQGTHLQPEFQEAVLALYRRMGANDIIWFDGHLENIYFENLEGKWVAGVLDADMILKWGEPPSSAFYAERLQRLQTSPASSVLGVNIFSLADVKYPAGLKRQRPNPESAKHLFPNADFFMEKMLEHKQYLAFRDGKFQGQMIDVGIATRPEFFPELGRKFEFTGDGEVRIVAGPALEPKPIPIRAAEKLVVPEQRNEIRDLTTMADVDEDIRMVTTQLDSVATRAEEFIPVPGLDPDSPEGILGEIRKVVLKLGAQKCRDQIKSLAARLAGATMTDPLGRTISIGQHLGAGNFSEVVSLKDKPSHALKFRIRGDLGESTEKSCQAAYDASQLLGWDEIPQVKATAVCAQGPFPYLECELIPEGWDQFSVENLKSLRKVAGEGKTAEFEKVAQEIGWTQGHGNAVVDLWTSLIEHKIIAEDLHIENLAWEKISDRGYRCRVLDHDRIAKWGTDRGQDVVRFVERHENGYAVSGMNMQSLKQHQPGTYRFQEHREFMVRMLEHKLWIRFDGKKWVSELLDLDYLRQRIGDIDVYLPKRIGNAPENSQMTRMRLVLLPGAMVLPRRGTRRYCSSIQLAEAA